MKATKAFMWSPIYLFIIYFQSFDCVLKCPRMNENGRCHFTVKLLRAIIFFVFHLKFLMNIVMINGKLYRDSKWIKRQKIFHLSLFGKSSKVEPMDCMVKLTKYDVRCLNFFTCLSICDGVSNIVYVIFNRMSNSNEQRSKIFHRTQ